MVPSSSKYKNSETEISDEKMSGSMDSGDNLDSDQEIVNDRLDKDNPKERQNSNNDDVLFDKSLLSENTSKEENEELDRDKNVKSEDEESSMASKITESPEEVVHNFQLKRYPLTVISIIKLIFRSFFGITAFIFHLLIAFIIGFIFNNLPMPSAIRGFVFRNLKSYFQHVINSTVGMWFPKKLYVSMDNRLITLFKTLSEKNENPCLLTISNHVTEFDWLFLSKLNLHLNLHRYTYFLVKKGVSKIPLMGYLMRIVGHTFIERERSPDPNKRSCDMIAVNNYAKSILRDYFNDRKSQIPILGSILNSITDFLIHYGVIRKNIGANALYFPESTIFEESTFKTSTEFYLKSLKNPSEFPGVFKPRYVLLPRPLGTTAVLTRVSKDIHCICDITIMTYPYFSSLYNNISYMDIFTCRAPDFSLGILIDYTDVPEELKEKIQGLGFDTSNFELPYLLTDKESEIKKSTTKFLNNIYGKKDKIIEEYVKGRTGGNFKNLQDFENFTQTIYGIDQRTNYALSVTSIYKIPIILSPFLFFGLIYYLFIRK